MQDRLSANPKPCSMRKLTVQPHQKQISSADNVPPFFVKQGDNANVQDIITLALLDNTWP